VTSSLAQEDRPLLRFVARSGVVTESRGAALRHALTLRSGGRSCSFAAWPNAIAPLQVVPLNRPALASWATETFEPWTRRPGPTAFLWTLLRSRALVVAYEPGPLAAVAEAALERVAGSMDPLFVSMTGGRASKLLCFVFDRDARAPGAVAKVIPDSRFAQGLRREVRVLDELRERGLPQEVAAALPAAPIAARTVGHDFVVVEPVDELGRLTGSADRDTALRWLERFHGATTSDTRAWAPEDTERLLASARYAWEHARPAHAAEVLGQIERLSAELHDAKIGRCTLHGDFWRGNLAASGGALRVFDWEWAEHDAAPFLDLWAYELAPLVERPWQSGDSELMDALEGARHAVRGELTARGLHGGFADATFAPALAELAFRFRRDRGIAGGSEARYARMMPAVERLLATEADSAN
jgi:hypothetical protein